MGFFKKTATFLSFFSLFLRADVEIVQVLVDTSHFDGPCLMIALQLAGHHMSYVSKWLLDQKILYARRVDEASRKSYLEQGVEYPGLLEEISFVNSLTKSMGMDVLFLDLNRAGTTRINTNLVFNPAAYIGRCEELAEKELHRFLSSPGEENLYLICSIPMEDSHHGFLIALNKNTNRMYVHLDRFTTKNKVIPYIRWIENAWNAFLTKSTKPCRMSIKHPLLVESVEEGPSKLKKTVKTKKERFLAAEFRDTRERIFSLRAEMAKMEEEDREVADRISKAKVRITRLEKAVLKKKKKQVSPRRR